MCNHKRDKARGKEGTKKRKKTNNFLFFFGLKGHCFLKFLKHIVGNVWVFMMEIVKENIYLNKRFGPDLTCAPVECGPPEELLHGSFMIDG